MRLQQLELGEPGTERAALRFHERLTMVSGRDATERAEIVDAILGTLAGRASPTSSQVWVERTGRRVRVDHAPPAVWQIAHDDGSPAVPPYLTLGLDVPELRDLVLVDARRLGVIVGGPSEPKDLADARAVLNELTDQVTTARIAQQAADALLVEPVAIDQEVQNAAIRLVPDIDRLMDRHAAVARRVTVLERAQAPADGPRAPEPAHIERQLRRLQARLGRCGRDGEPLPLVLDDALAPLRIDAKWSVLDALDQLSRGGQVIYLTNDNDTMGWAVRRDVPTVGQSIRRSSDL